MDQRRRLQSLPGILLSQALGRELAQLPVHQRQQVLCCPRIALLDCGKDAGDIVHWREPKVSDESTGVYPPVVNKSRNSAACRLRANRIHSNSLAPTCCRCPENRAMKALLTVLLFAGTCSLTRAEMPAYERKTDVIYGRKHGVCLSMDVFAPKAKPNGAAIIAVISGGWI